MGRGCIVVAVLELVVGLSRLRRQRLGLQLVVVVADRERYGAVRPPVDVGIGDGPARCRVPSPADRRLGVCGGRVGRVEVC